MKILLSAYSCAPGMGSEPGVGWNWAKMLASRHEVHVLTRDVARDSIEAELEKKPSGNLKFHYVRGALGALPLWLRYYFWQRKALTAARRLHAEVKFDLAHHVTFATWRVPSFLWKLGIPFFWGPIGGGQAVPHGFGSILGFRGTSTEVLRGIFQILSKKDPFVRSAMRNSAVILAANKATAEFIPERFKFKTRVLAGVGIDVPPLGKEPGSSGDVLEILWVGRLLPLKGLPLLLSALARAENRVKYRLTVAGEGPDRRRCEKLCRKLGIEGEVRFAGALPHAEIGGLYSATDAFVFTSLRETSGVAVLEAMAHALPVICLNWAGPSDLTTDDTAIRIRPGSPAQVIRELAESIERLAGDRELRGSLGGAGRKRTESEFAWMRKLDEIEKVYSEIVEI